MRIVNKLNTGVKSLGGTIGGTWAVMKFIARNSFAGLFAGAQGAAKSFFTIASFALLSQAIVTGLLILTQSPLADQPLLYVGIYASTYSSFTFNSNFLLGIAYAMLPMEFVILNGIRAGFVRLGLLFERNNELKPNPLFAPYKYAEKLSASVGRSVDNFTTYTYDGFDSGYATAERFISTGSSFINSITNALPGYFTPMHRTDRERTLRAQHSIKSAPVTAGIEPAMTTTNMQHEQHQPSPMS